MTARDRLVADLHAADCKVNRLYCDGQRCEDIADRLIALGWTRLDEERLARALVGLTDVAIYGESSQSIAAAIVKAYREDT